LLEDDVGCVTDGDDDSDDDDDGVLEAGDDGGDVAVDLSVLSFRCR